MTQEAARTIAAVADIAATNRARDEACARLERALEASDGVPIRELDPDDSMAVALDDAKRETQEAITRTERSRRAVGVR